MDDRHPNTERSTDGKSLEFFCRNALFLDAEDRGFLFDQINKTAAFLGRICNPFPVGIFLYGSLARGEPSCGREKGGRQFLGSDLDLIMVCRAEDRPLADQLALYINTHLQELDLAARTDPNPGAKFVKVESLDEVRVMRGFAASTMAMAIKQPLYGSLDVEPPMRGEIDSFMLLDQLASRIVQVTKADTKETLPRYHGNSDPAMNRYYHDLYHKLRFGLDCCRAALGPNVEHHSYREVFDNRHHAGIKQLFSEKDLAQLVKARECFGVAEAPSFDVPTTIGKTLDIVVGDHKLRTFLDRLHWPLHLYQMAILLAYAGSKTKFAGDEQDEAFAALMERVIDIFSINPPDSQAEWLDVLVDGASEYTEFREAYNHGRLNNHLKTMISSC